MSSNQIQNFSLTDGNDKLMVEFRKLRDETQPIHNNLMALTPTPIVNQSDGQLLRELQLMRTEVKQIQNEMKEKLEMMRMGMSEVKSNQEILKNDQYNLSMQVALVKKDLNTKLDDLKKNQRESLRNQEIVKESQEFVKNCLQEVKTSHVDLKKTVTDNAANLDILKTKIESVSTQIDKISEKVPETNCLPTIKEQFFGKWKCTTRLYMELISLKFVDDKLIMKWDKDQPHVYTWGVAHSDGWTAHLEDEKIVQLKPNYRREIYLENGSLVYEGQPAGAYKSKSTFTRIGDPDV